MLGADQRLRRRDEFTAAVRGGRRAGRGAVVVHLLTIDTGAADEHLVTTEGPARTGVFPSRAGFIVPKTVGGAVVRNRVRRRLRHLVRERLTGWPDGTVLVVRALPVARAATYRQLGLDLDAALAAVRRPRGPGGAR